MNLERSQPRSQPFYGGALLLLALLVVPAFLFSRTTFQQISTNTQHQPPIALSTQVKKTWTENSGFLSSSTFYYVSSGKRTLEIDRDLYGQLSVGDPICLHSNGLYSVSAGQDLDVFKITPATPCRQKDAR